MPKCGFVKKNTVTAGEKRGRVIALSFFLSCGEDIFYYFAVAIKGIGWEKFTFVGNMERPKRQIGGTFEVVIDPPGMRGHTRDERGGNWFDRGLADWDRDRAKTR